MVGPIKKENALGPYLRSLDLEIFGLGWVSIIILIRVFGVFIQWDIFGLVAEKLLFSTDQGESIPGIMGWRN